MKPALLLSTSLLGALNFRGRLNGRKAGLSRNTSKNIPSSWAEEECLDQLFSPFPTPGPLQSLKNFAAHLRPHKYGGHKMCSQSTFFLLKVDYKGLNWLQDKNSFYFDIP